MTTRRALMIGLLLPVLALAEVDTLWTRLYPSTMNSYPKPCYATDISADAAGNVYVCGATNYPEDSSQRMATFKYDESGTQLWARFRGGLATNALGNIAHALAMDPAGNISVVGTVDDDVAPVLTDQDVAWARYTSSGTELWFDSLHLLGDDVLYDAAAGTDGYLYACGGRWNNPLSTTDFLVVKVDPSTGDTVWTRSYVLDQPAFGNRPKRPARPFRHPDFFEEWDEWDNCATAMAIAPDGNIVVTGFGLDTTYERDWWTMKFAPDGTRLWDSTYHNPLTVDVEEDDIAFDVAVANDGNIYVAGFDFFDDEENQDQEENFCVVRYGTGGQRLGYASVDGGIDLASDCATAVCLDNASPQNVYVTGWAEYNSPAIQILTHKFSHDLTFKAWGLGGARYGGNLDDYGYDMCYKSGRVYVTGSSGKDLAAVCYRDATTSPNPPAPAWSYVYNGPGDTLADVGTAIWVNDTDHVYVAGQSFRKTGAVKWSSLFLARLFYRLNDVGADAILSPAAEIPYDTTVQPVVRIKNLGNSATICSLHVVIKDPLGVPVYDTTETGILVPLAGTERTLAKSWHAASSGVYSVVANTVLDRDGNFANDTCRSTCTVVYTDAGATAVNAPAGTIPRDTVVNPEAVATNFGTKQVTVGVRIIIDDGTGATVYDTTETGITIPAGAQATRRFTKTWKATPAGEYQTLAYTILAADQDPGNDTAKGTCTVAYTDAGVTAIHSPAGELRRDSAVTAEVVIENFGTQDATLGCRLVVFAAGDTAYDTTETGILVPVGSPVTHRFTGAWVASPEGDYSVAAFTLLARDQNYSDDTTRGTCKVVYTDAAAGAIAAPAGNIADQTLVTPSVIIRNFGNKDVTVDVRMLIDDLTDAIVYDTTETGVNVPAGANVTHLFTKTWTATPPGTYKAKAYTILAGDQNPADDTVWRTFKVVAIDAGVTDIVMPAGRIEEGTQVTPEVVIANFGSTQITASVQLIVDNGPLPAEYDTTETGIVIGPATSIHHQFALKWTAGPRGDYTTRSYTILAGDEDPSNDTTNSTCRITYTDAAAVAIVEPSGDVRLNAVVAPEVELKNLGTEEVTTDVRLVVEDGTQDAIVYDTTETGVVLPVGPSVTHTFTKTWTAGPHLGAYHVRSYTKLALDHDPSNDTVKADCRVIEAAAPDAGLTRILAPVIWVDTNRAVMPQALVENHGNVPVSFTAWFVMAFHETGTEIYRRSLDVADLAVGKDSTLSFDEWPGTKVEGSYVTRCSLALADSVPANDTTSGRFRVSSHAPWPEGWVEAEPMPALPSGKQVKDGGWLAVNAGKVYAAKGYKTTDFYCYDPPRDTWVRLESIPPDESGRDKPPRDGCRGVADGEDGIFMTKGNNTLGFWRYDTRADTWGRLPNVPLGDSRKKVKGGADLAYVVREDTGWVYLLKGYRNEFYRFNVAARRWDTLEPAPYGSRNKYDKGSFLALDPAGTIYCHQSSFYDKTGPVLRHYMFKYDVLADSWYRASLHGLPLYGLHGGRVRKKKAKDGSAGAWYDGNLFALKGGNSQQFFRYFPNGDSWQELDTVPSVGATGRKKYVKQGGDLVVAVDAFWALKGNKTVEFWRYGPRFGARVAGGVPRRDGVAGASPKAPKSSFSVLPNPVTDRFAVLRCDLPAGAGRVGTVRIFDVLGRVTLARKLIVGHSGLAVPLDLRTLASGVYLVRLDAGAEFSRTVKLVVR